MNAPDFLGMTADTIGKDLLQALVTEIRLMPDVWPKLSQAKQDDILDRLRMRIGDNVRMAVHLIAADGRTVVTGDLEQITIKDGAKAVIKVSRSAESLHELYDAQGKAVLVVVADVGNHVGGMDEIVGEADQRAMDLGHEYHNNDGGGMDGKADEPAATVINGEATEVLGLPSPDDVTPTPDELQQAFDDGAAAAEAGKDESACPVVRGPLCIQWIKGWKAWHEQHPQATEPNAIKQQAGVTDTNPDQIRYRNPEDPNQTWSGRGRKPQWVVDWLADGKELTDLEVTSPKKNPPADLDME